MSPLTLSHLKSYEGKWVALSDNNQRVLGAGKTAKAAIQEAKSKGHSDTTLMFVQPSNLLYCGFIV